MERKELMAQFGSMSTVRIQSGLERNLWEDEKKQAAIAILEKRGKLPPSTMEKECVVYEDKETLSPEQLKNVQQALGTILECGDHKLIDQTVAIMGESEISDLSQNQVESILLLLKEVPTAPPPIPQPNLPKAKRGKKTKSIVELSKEKKQIAEEILQKLTTKKQMILDMIDNGFTRSEILSLRFVDPVFVYDLWREYYREAKK